MITWLTNCFVDDINHVISIFPFAGLQTQLKIRSLQFWNLKICRSNGLTSPPNLPRCDFAWNVIWNWFSVFPLRLRSFLIFLSNSFRQCNPFGLRSSWQPVLYVRPKRKKILGQISELYSGFILLEEEARVGQTSYATFTQLINRSFPQNPGGFI